jgi:hypothetical protein
MMLDRASWMNLPLGFDVGVMRFFRACKRADMYAPINGIDGGSKFTPRPAYAKKPGTVPALWPVPVLRVDSGACVTKIGNAIVSAITVNMIDLALRPLAVHVQPNESVGIVNSAVNTYSNTAAFVSRKTNWCALRLPFWGCKLDLENSGIWIVVQKFAQTLRGKIGLSHDAVLSLIGQRLGSVSALAGLRYFRG